MQATRHFAAANPRPLPGSPECSRQPLTSRRCARPFQTIWSFPNISWECMPFYNGEVVFARDVVQVNMEFSPFPVDFENLWDWLREQIRGSPAQETFAYETTFGIEDEDDPVMEKLIEMTQSSANTIWMIDLAHQETPEAGRRFVIVTAPDEKRAQDFRDEFHGRDVAIS